MKTKKISIFLIVIILITFVSCSNNIGTTASNSDSIVNSDVTDNSESNDISDVESTDSFEERKEMFIKMANHDNYIMGYIIESYIYNTDEKNYVIVETVDGKKYRVEGFDSEHWYIAGYFFLEYSYSVYKGSMIGKDVVVFYDEVEELSDGTYYIEKAKEFIGVKDDCEMIEIAKMEQKRADIFLKNFNAIEDPVILSPEEAMLAVIYKYNFATMKRFIDEQGRLAYQDEDGNRLLLSRILFNEGLGMSQQEQEAHMALTRKSRVCRPYWGRYPEVNGEEAFIVYIIEYEKNPPDIGRFYEYEVFMTGEVRER